MGKFDYIFDSQITEDRIIIVDYAYDEATEDRIYSLHIIDLIQPNHPVSSYALEKFDYIDEFQIIGDRIIIIGYEYDENDEKNYTLHIIDLTRPEQAISTYNNITAHKITENRIICLGNYQENENAEPVYGLHLIDLTHQNLSVTSYAAQTDIPDSFPALEELIEKKIVLSNRS